MTFSCSSRNGLTPSVFLSGAVNEGWSSASAVNGVEPVASRSTRSSQIAIIDTDADGEDDAEFDVVPSGDRRAPGDQLRRGRQTPGRRRHSRRFVVRAMIPVNEKITQWPPVDEEEDEESGAEENDLEDPNTKAIQTDFDWNEEDDEEQELAEEEYEEEEEEEAEEERFVMINS